jgi:hypothetical protein
MYSTERLADAVGALASRVREPELRAQLHALDGIIRNVAVPAPDPAQRAAHEAALRAAMQDGDEVAAIAAMRRLAALERAPLQPVDWSSASGG